MPPALFFPRRTALYALVVISALIPLSATASPILVQGLAQSALNRESSDRPLTYVLVDGGAIEEGRTLAGDPPPDPAQLAGHVRAGLLSAGFEPVSPGQTPDVLLIYHWGALRNVGGHAVDGGGHAATGSENHVLLARMRLLSRDGAADAFYHLLNESPRNSGAAAPALSRAAKDLKEAARHERYFFVLTAYRHEAVRTGNPVLLARSKASCLTRGASLKGAVRLAAAAAQALGRNQICRTGRARRRIPCPPTQRSNSNPPRWGSSGSRWSTSWRC